MNIKRARVLLASAVLAVPFSAGALALPATALAQPVAHHAKPYVTCSGGVAVKSAAINPGNVGSIVLCYNGTTRTVWAQINSNMPVCQQTSGTGPGCGGALVHNNNTGQQAECSIARGARSCVTGHINDKNTLSYASGTLITALCGGRVCRTSFGETGTY